MINSNSQEKDERGAEGKIAYLMEAESPGSSAEQTPSEGADAELEDAARDEREYVRERLREELGREPTPEELDEWLRQHTEGY
ncbi:MAG TPA: hypothetical protein VF553_11580 [Pyrinomonadaceae bacterium]|jgi:hypothetical protein